jgi:RNA exonuclease 4
MGKPFFTKKQKAQMRQRRKKKTTLAVVEGMLWRNGGMPTPEAQPDNTLTNRTEQSQVPSKKRPRHGSDDQEQIVDADSAEAKTSTTTSEGETRGNGSSSSSPPSMELTTKTMDGKLYVLIPSDLPTKAAKKFRKDARRQLRDLGRHEHGDCDIEFATQEEMPSLRPNNHSKKAKTATKEFPSIKELLKQKHEMEQQRRDEAKLQEKLNMIPEAVRAQYVALDCEMVGIGTEGRKSALARVSLVDWNLNVLLDTFVQVPIRVTDFRTHVSGVEPKHLKNQNGAMDVKECRDKVAQLIKGKVLVGHALTNDFKALMLTHPKDKIRDTSKYRPFQRYGNGKWRARKLRDLVKENLKGKEGFQEGEHDSVQDARATMELFQVVYSQWEKDISNKTRS